MPFLWEKGPANLSEGMISDGMDLKLYTQWTAQGTTILHALTGEDYHITHQIELRPAATRAENPRP
jgi:hypothetical protein